MPAMVQHLVAMKVAAMVLVQERALVMDRGEGEGLWYAQGPG